MHTQQQKDRLIARVRRIAGQIRAVEGALKNGADCAEILHALTGARGAMNSLIVEVLEDHVRCFILDPDQRPGTPRAEATEELFGAIRSYLK